MAYWKELQSQLEAEFRVQVVLDHIPGTDNEAPDALSLGRVADALTILRQAGHVPQSVVLRVTWVSSLNGLLQSAGRDGNYEAVWA